MAFIETASQKFDTNSPPHHKSDAYPTVDPELPNLFPCGVFCGAVGSGKTTQCARLISKYIELGAKDHGQQVFQRVIIFSPSIDANPVWGCIPKVNLVKSDKISGYSDEIMKKLWDEMRDQKKSRDKWLLEMKLFRHMKRSTQQYEDLAPELHQWSPRNSLDLLGSSCWHLS